MAMKRMRSRKKRIERWLFFSFFFFIVNERDTIKKKDENHRRLSLLLSPQKPVVRMRLNWREEKMMKKRKKKEGHNTRRVCVCAFYASDGAFISRQRRRTAFLRYDTTEAILYTLRRVDIIMTITMIASNSGYYGNSSVGISRSRKKKGNIKRGSNLWSL